MQAIADERRVTEKDLWNAFERKRPLILGSLLDAVVMGLSLLPITTLERLPRMADFALFVTACESAMWPAGTFMKAYTGNRGQAVDIMIDTDPSQTPFAVL